MICFCVVINAISIDSIRCNIVFAQLDNADSAVFAPNGEGEKELTDEEKIEMLKQQIAACWARGEYDAAEPYILALYDYFNLPEMLPVIQSNPQLIADKESMESFLKNREGGKPEDAKANMDKIVSTVKPVETAKTEETKTEETKTEETKTEETKTEETKTEETKTEEIKTEEAKTEETKNEEVKVEETKTPVEEILTVGMPEKTEEDKASSIEGDKEETSTKSEVVWLGDREKPETVVIGNRTRPETVVIGDREKPETVVIGNRTTLDVLEIGYVYSDPCAGNGCYSSSYIESAASTYRVPAGVVRSESTYYAPESVAPASTYSNPNPPARASQSAQSASVPDEPDVPELTASAPLPQEEGSITAATLSASQTSLEAAASLTITPGESTIDLLLGTRGAQNVLFYIEGGSLVAPQYLGQGLLLGDQTRAGRADMGLAAITNPLPNDQSWKYRVDLNDGTLPNGNYQVWAQIVKNSVSVRSDKYPLAINILIKSDPVQQERIEQSVSQSSQAIETSAKAIDLATKETVKAIVKETSADPNVEINIQKIAQIVGEIGELDYDLADKTAQLVLINARIEKMAADIAALPQDAVGAIKDDKIKALAAARAQAEKLGQEIADIKDSISRKTREKQTLVETIVAAVRGKDNEANVAKILDDFERTISLQKAEILESGKILEKDSDGDGLSDGKEISIGTDPFSPDSDGDGILDGDEVNRKYDPLAPDNFGGIKYHDPRTVTPNKTDIYKFDDTEPVASVKLVDGSAAIRFKGWGLPNSYVTLYIYSDPIIVVVKTDDAGQWTYILDKPLSDGQHAVYAAQTDSVGDVQARSEVLVFMKNGNTVTKMIANQEATISSSTEKMKNNFGLAVIAAIALAFGAALFVIGFATRKKSGSSGKEAAKIK